MPASEDSVLVTLKGHLLVEELLEELIWLKCRAPEYLKRARLSFAQKAAMAHALTGTNHETGLVLPDSFWPMIEALNELRNDLAHRLEGEKRDERMKKLIGMMAARTGGRKIEGSLAASLRLAIEGLLGYLACFEFAVRTGTIPPEIEA